MFDAQQNKECSEDGGRLAEACKKSQGVEKIAGNVSRRPTSSGIPQAYTATIDMGIHDRSFLGEAYTSDTGAAPDAAIWYNVSAVRTSSAVYRSVPARRPIQVAGEGKKEKSDSKKGA